MNSELFKALKVGGPQGAPGITSVTAPAMPGADLSPSPAPGSLSPLTTAMQHQAPLQPGVMVADNGDQMHAAQHAMDPQGRFSGKAMTPPPPTPAPAPADAEPSLLSKIAGQFKIQDLGAAQYDKDKK